MGNQVTCCHFIQIPKQQIRQDDGNNDATPAYLPLRLQETVVSLDHIDIQLKEKSLQVLPPLSQTVQNVLSQLGPFETEIDQQKLNSFLVHIEGKGSYYGQLNDLKQFHGRGKFYYDNQNFLQGFYALGKPNGRTRFIFSDGSYYQGDMENGKVTGRGKFVGKDYLYEGEWVNGLPHGNGHQKKQGVFQYTGFFQGGKKNGRGRLSLPNLTTYEGGFLNDKFDGTGTLRNKSGNYYEGGWKQGMMDGQGSYFWVNKDQLYVGKYQKNKKHGQGEYYIGQNMFKGNWKNGLREGEGILQVLNQEFKGVWRSGKLQE